MLGSGSLVMVLLIWVCTSGCYYCCNLQEDKAAAATLTNEIYLSLKDRPVQVLFFPQPLMLQFCSPTLVRIGSEVQEFPN
jgi:hypothetical protein